jgi:hypothetical protein
MDDGRKAGRAVAVVGDVDRFLATGAETQGRYAQWKALAPPGGGPPLAPAEMEKLLAVAAKYGIGILAE